MAKGISRIPNGWVNEDSAWVVYKDGKQLEVPRSRYEAQGYSPPFDELPIKEPHDGGNSIGNG